MTIRVKNSNLTAALKPKAIVNVQSWRFMLLEEKENSYKLLYAVIFHGYETET